MHSDAAVTPGNTLYNKWTKLGRIQQLITNYYSERNAYLVLAPHREGNRPPGRPWCKWEDNIKYDGVQWITLVHEGIL
jgi:hypothetical protein